MKRPSVAWKGPPRPRASHEMRTSQGEFTHAELLAIRPRGGLWKCWHIWIGRRTISSVIAILETSSEMNMRPDCLAEVQSMKSSVRVISCFFRVAGDIQQCRFSRHHLCVRVYRDIIHPPPSLLRQTCMTTLLYPQRHTKATPTVRGSDELGADCTTAECPWPGLFTKNPSTSVHICTWCMCMVVQCGATDAIDKLGMTAWVQGSSTDALDSVGDAVACVALTGNK